MIKRKIPFQKNDKPGFFIYGYFGAENAGDEMILSAFLRALESRTHGAARVAVASADSGGRFEQCHRASAGELELAFVRRSRNPLGWSNLKNFWNCDCLVYPGGGIFQDYGTLSFWCYYSMVLAAKFLGRGVFILFQGFTGLRSPLHRKALEYLVRNIADHVSVRDESSKAFLPPAKYPSGTKTADASFILYDYLRCASREARDNGEGGFYTVGISFREWKGFGPREAAEVVKTVLEDPGARVRLYAMQSPADEDFNAAVASELSSEDCMRLEVYGLICDFHEFAVSIAANSYNVGMRFHFCAASAMCAVACIGLSYDDKVLELFRQMNLKELCIVLSPSGLTREGGLCAKLRARASLARRRRMEIGARLDAFSSSGSSIAMDLFDEFIRHAGIGL